MDSYTQSSTYFGWFYLSHFFEKTRPGWKVTISTDQGIGIPLLLHAREGVSYLRPSLNSPSVKSDQWSPSLFFVTLSLPFLFCLAFFLPRLLPLSSSLIFTGNPERPALSVRRRILNVILVENRISGAKSSGHSVHSNGRNFGDTEFQAKFTCTKKCVCLGEFDL